MIDNIFEDEKTIIKGFKSKIGISNELKEVFKQSSGNRRFIYNHLLNILETSYETGIKKINYIEQKEVDDVISFIPKSISINSKKGIQRLLVTLQEDNIFLSKSHSQSNQEPAHSLSSAYQSFFNPKLKKHDKPR